MTNALRGFNMEINETSAQRINDVYSKLAAITASNTDEISGAMTKTASIASSANMSFEKTSALLAHMIEVTREAPENLGTAMKTIIARFTEMKNSPTEIFKDADGEEVNVNKVDAALRSVGVSLKDTEGNFRNLDDVFLELSKKWDSLDVMQQRYVATTAAGSRQQSRFIAMMQDYDRTMNLVAAANGSAGASQLQYEKTLDSLESKLNQLQNAWHTFILGITDSSLIKTGIDLLTTLLNIINKITDVLPKGADGVAKLGIAFVALKGVGRLLEAGIAKISATFSTQMLANMTATGEVAGQQFAISFNKSAQAGMAADGAQTGQRVGLFNGFSFSRGGFSNLGSNIKNKWTNFAYNGTTYKEAKAMTAERQEAFVGKAAEVDMQSKLDAKFGTDLYPKKLNELQKEFDLSGRKIKKFEKDVIQGGQSVEDFSGKIGKVKPQLSGMMQSIQKMAIIAATMAAVQFVVEKIDDAIVTASKKITSLNQALSDVGQEVTKNQDILNNYDKTKQDYDDLVNNLYRMSEGTAEWTNNLVKVNTQTQEAISKFAELQKYTENVRGALVLTEEGWSKYQDKVAEQLAQQSQVQTGLQNQLTEAQRTKNLEATGISTASVTSTEQSNIKTTSMIGGAAAGVIGGSAAAGAVAGSVVPVVGTIIGAVAGLLIGGITAAVIGGVGEGIASLGLTDKEAQNLSSFAQEKGFVAETATDDEIDKFVSEAEKAGLALGGLADIIKEDGAKFDEWIQNEVNAELEEESQRDSLISQIISSNADMQNSSAAEAIRNVADLGDSKYKEFLEKAQEEAEDLGDDQLKAQYGKLMNLTSDEIEAKMESKELSKETMQSAVAAKNATEKWTETMRGSMKKLEELTKKASKADFSKSEMGKSEKASAVLSLISGGKNVSKKQYNALGLTAKDFSDIKWTKKTDVTKAETTINEALEELDVSLAELGVGAEEFVSELKTTESTLNNLNDKYGAQSISFVNSQYANAGNKDELSVGAQETLAKAYNLADNTGKGYLGDFYSQLSKEMANATPEIRQKIMESISKLNPADSKEWGDFFAELDDNKIHLTNFKNSVIEATGATHNYSTEEVNNAIATGKKAESIISDKMEGGDATFSKEEYDAIIAASPSQKERFTQIGDEYVYQGNIINLLGAIKSDTDKIKNKITKPGGDKSGDKSGGSADLNQTANALDYLYSKGRNGKGKSIDEQIREGYGEYSNNTTQYSTKEPKKYIFASATNTPYAFDDTTAFAKTLNDTYDRSKNVGIANDIGEGMFLSVEELRKAYKNKYNGKELASTTQLTDEVQNELYNYIIEQNKEAKESDTAKNIKQQIVDALREIGIKDENGKDYTTDTDINTLYKKYDEQTGNTGTYNKDAISKLTKDDFATFNSNSLLNYLSSGDFDADIINEMADALEAQAKAADVDATSIAELTDELHNGTAEERKSAAQKLLNIKAQTEQKKKVDAYSKSLQENVTKLKSVKKGTLDYNKSLTSITDQMNDIMGTNVDYSFFQDPENFKLLEKAINGSVDAYTKLQQKMLSTSLGSQDFWDNMGINITNVEGGLQGLQNTWDNLEFDATGKADFSGLNNAIIHSKEEMNALQQTFLNSGYSAQIKTTKKKVSVPDLDARPAIKYKDEYIEVITGVEVTKRKSTSPFSPSSTSSGSGGGGGSSKSYNEKNTSKNWHTNRDTKQEKRSKKLAGYENDVNIELTKQIPNLEKINKLNKNRYNLLKKEKSATKGNVNAAKDRWKKLQKQAKKYKGLLTLNDDGTVSYNIGNYNKKKWKGKKGEKAKKAFDKFEADVTDTSSYLQDQKDKLGEVELQIAQLKNARSEYTKITNLQEKITNQQNRQNKLQTEYNQILKSRNTSGKALVKNLLAQEDSLQKQLELQKNIKKANQDALAKAVKNSKAGKYFSYNKKTGEYTVDYGAINKLAKEGKDIGPIEEEIAKLIEYANAISEADNEIASIEQSQLDAEQDRLNATTELQEKIRAAIIESRQKEIDALSNINSSINDTNSKIIKSVQDNISKIRQDRKNEKTEEDLANKETRLAYLKQFTGTGNTVEIAKLEKELKEGRESYTDTLIDQKISELQKQNDEASRQRERQITILNKQLAVDQKNGAINKQVSQLLAESIKDGGIDWSSGLGKLLSQTDEFNKNMITSEQFQIATDALEELVAKFTVYNSTTPNAGNKDTGETSGTNKITAYATGGLADFTGPAWLDGTKSKPEIILNQKDSENFIQLRNILADILHGTSVNNTQTNGDLNYEIHINVEKMTSDYDVDKVAKRVKKIINDDGRYRNVNQINRLR